MTANSELLNRITARADVFHGKPIIREMRIAVEHILGMLASGDTAETILKECPVLEAEAAEGNVAVVGLPQVRHHRVQRLAEEGHVRVL